MPGNPGEKAAQDKNNRWVQLGIRYTDADSRTALIRNRRVTNEGFAVAGHGRFKIDLWDEEITTDPKETRTVDIREREFMLVTWENDQDGDIDINWAGRYDVAGQSFALEFDDGTFLMTLAPGEAHYETISDPFGWLALGVDPASAGQTGNFKLVVQERT